jgi:hypothetical protein
MSEVRCFCGTMKFTPFCAALVKLILLGVAICQTFGSQLRPKCLDGGTKKHRRLKIRSYMVDLIGGCRHSGGQKTELS